MSKMLISISLRAHARCGAECRNDCRSNRCDDLYDEFKCLSLCHSAFYLLISFSFKQAGGAEAPSA